MASLRTSLLSQSLATHTKLWYLIDAKDQVVGRLAVMVSLILQGKTKPIYHSSVDTGDYVVIINTRKVVFTGQKWNKKLYRHHTGYPGGLKEILSKDVHKKDPTKVLYKAINGCLPKNGMRLKRMNRLYLFPDEEHPYAKNIYKVLDGPCQPFKKLEDFTIEEIESFPNLRNDFKFKQ
ncbi:PREDICTED: 39S ribosomal protein L13, mitochondrial-like [Amphimedon queenslandica]|uniref:Large ribosomal subunit protein uL13m n=1 Tax=Amphimedon queenslandica TaxID=400682 RepID=A0A1X7VF42_AMPQE|nr:PREDICTED: 39S ribosomal protein L13, mitochondrial-like [Amphimedon queenslandica]|eukprot:XP_003384471.1 PREDICTED: 39S ribosomal protein L13, mitochondrial-like [Amphimedon queenslandica]